MNIDKDIERRSIWTNVALFMIGVVILAFLARHDDDKSEVSELTDAPETHEAAFTGQDNLPENALIAIDYYDDYSKSVPIYKTDDVNSRADYLSRVSYTGEKTGKDASNYIELYHPNTEKDDLITAAR